MSSIIIHLCISEIIKQKNNFSDEFLVGAIAPDIYKKYNSNRDSTHYITIINNNGKIKKLPDIEAFLEKNKDEKSEFLLGYLAHLIEDRIWFDKYVPLFADSINENKVMFKKDNSIHTDAEFSTEMYLDYSDEDRYILSKVPINIEEIRETSKRYFNNEELNIILDNQVKLFDNIEDRENCFLTDEIIEEYIDDCIKECEKILSNII